LNPPSSGGTTGTAEGPTVKICTWDRSGLFSKIAGSFTATSLNIHSAQIFTRLDGIIIDTFFVTTARTGFPVEKEDREKFEALLHKALVSNVDFGPLISRRKGTSPLFQSLEGERIPTAIRFDNETSEHRTVIDLETEDRVGLLYTVSQTLSEMGLDIAVAKISTDRGAAIDSFYVSDSAGRKVLATDWQGSVEGRLRAAILNLDSVK